MTTKEYLEKKKEQQTLEEIAEQGKRKKKQEKMLKKKEQEEKAKTKINYDIQKKKKQGKSQLKKKKGVGKNQEQKTQTPDTTLKGEASTSNYKKKKLLWRQIPRTIRFQTIPTVSGSMTVNQILTSNPLLLWLKMTMCLLSTMVANILEKFYSWKGIV